MALVNDINLRYIMVNKTEQKIAFFRGGIIFLLFWVTACFVSYFRSQIAYFALFAGIGVVAGVTEFAIAYKPLLAQKIRKGSLISLALTLFILALAIGINFQFSQIFIDMYAGIITGALIQFIGARLIMPFFFGNIFCSRACWDGAVFELFEGAQNNNPHKCDQQERSAIAWIFLVIVITVASIYTLYGDVAPGSGKIRWVFLIENFLIISVGLFAFKIKGSRYYCRNLCPFLTISSRISPFSLFKVTPVASDKCIECGKCTAICPMHIDVMKYVQEGKRVDHPNCIMCEQCVTACPKQSILVAPKFF